ncbi:MAG TPA: PQQ-binding-like beta-propeller repeat protein [Bryobacteraceae bacterium]|nr:PQQ-binding-like beta-propeller repeat protein [Bryobacteraceae bacterium]
MNRRTFLLSAGVAVAAKADGAAWTQWGGPRRNFTAEAKGLKTNWPPAGPKVIWKRPLGEGYSSPSVEAGVLFTMYGRRGEEIVTAIDARTGKTLWEQATPTAFRSDAREMGNGPYSTPLVAGECVFTAGVSGRLQGLDKRTGKLVWTQMLWENHGGTRLMYGYASSPIAFRDTIIVPSGGKGRATIAFRQADGKVVWAKGSIPNAYSSPLLIDVGGLEQLVEVMDGMVFGLNPHNGDLQWQIPFRADYGIAVATPVWCPGNLLFVSAEYGAGSKMIHLERSGTQTRAKEAWSSNRLRLHNGNAMWISGTLYFTSGGKGSQAILSAVDAASGRIYWQERSIQKATFVWADGKLITLDQDGYLMLAVPSPKEFRVVAKSKLLSNLSWTPPVLVGTTLYLRDRKDILAVELG